MAYNFSTKEELLKNMRSYLSTPDNDAIRFKAKIKKHLLDCPELLWALNNKDLESELFNEDGSLNEEGSWDRYFGVNIKDYLYIPETQRDTKHHLCYQVSFDETPNYNSFEKYAEIRFIIFCNGDDNDIGIVGTSRHDLIAAILQECFNWSNIFSLQCRLTSDEEGITDNNYVMRTLIFECVLPNSVVQTKNGVTGYINHINRRK